VRFLVTLTVLIALPLLGCDRREASNMSDPELTLTEEERRAEEVNQAVMKAARVSNNGTVNRSLPEGTIVMSELTYWSSLGNLGKVKLALQKNPNVNQADADGYTALHFAAENGHVEVVRLLLAKGADRTKRAKGKTPTDLASQHPEVLKLLAAK
jgi:ankyrin repeat protein